MIAFLEVFNIYAEVIVKKGKKCNNYFIENADEICREKENVL